MKNLSEYISFLDSWIYEYIRYNRKYDNSKYREILEDYKLYRETLVKSLKSENIYIYNE